MNFVRKQQNSRKRYSSKFEYDKLYFEIHETWDNSIVPCFVNRAEQTMELVPCFMSYENLLEYIFKIKL